MLAHRRQLQCAEFHPDGVTVAVAGRDSAVRVYDVRNRCLLQEYNAHEGIVNSMHFHPSGDCLVTGASDSLTRVFDVLKGRLLYTLVTHMKPVHAVCFSHDGNHFATGGDDRQVFLWTSYNADSAGAQQSGSGDAGTRNSDNGEPAVGSTTAAAKPVAVVRSVAQVSTLNQGSSDQRLEVNPSANGSSFEARLEQVVTQLTAKMELLSQAVSTLNSKVLALESVVAEQRTAVQQPDQPKPSQPEHNGATCAD